MQQPSAPSSTHSPFGYTLGIDIGTASVAVAAAVDGEVKALDGLIFGGASHPRTMEPNYKAHRRKLRMSAPHLGAGSEARCAHKAQTDSAPEGQGVKSPRNAALHVRAGLPRQPASARAREDAR